MSIPNKTDAMILAFAFIVTVLAVVGFFAGWYFADHDTNCPTFLGCTIPK